MISPVLFSITVSAIVCQIEARRPLYVIGHMVNSIPEVTEFLNKGANALESDITFHNNGTVRRIYHGYPCDCHRICNYSAKLSEYLDHLRRITDPNSGSYKEQLIFQFFDMKLTNLDSSGKLRAGYEMADLVLDHLWGENPAEAVVRVILYINSFTDNSTIIGFRKRFKDRGVEDLLKNVGYDGGMGDLKPTRNMWRSIGVTSNIWQGDGTINCFNKVYPDKRLMKELYTRDSYNGYIQKVYHWTIDNVLRMHKSLDLQVDGMITNVPDILVDVLKEEKFSKSFRLANASDDPFEKYTPVEDQ